MTDLYLDLRDRTRVLDFIEEMKGYLPEIMRQRLEQELNKLEALKPLAEVELATLAKLVGRQSWSARQALRAYLKTPAGCKDEWQRLVALVSRSTGHLLERFRSGTTCVGIDEVLEHEEAASAFRDLERYEIAAIRTKVHQTIWGEQRRAQAKSVAEFEQILSKIVKRLERLRSIAVMAPWLQDEIFSKLERLEDRLYFEGEVLEVERLDVELNFYRDEAELPVEAVYEEKHIKPRARD